MTLWETPDIKPKNDNDIVCMVGALPFTGYYEKSNDAYVEHATGENYAPDEIDRWAYIDDLIAAADRAKRLQKAVGTALISIGTAAILDGEDAKKYADAKIDLIKQLTKGE